LVREAQSFLADRDGALKFRCQEVVIAHEGCVAGAAALVAELGKEGSRLAKALLDVVQLAENDKGVAQLEAQIDRQFKRLSAQRQVAESIDCTAEVFFRLLI